MLVTELLPKLHPAHKNYGIAENVGIWQLGSKQTFGRF